jgi:hypothetical protein
MSMGDHVTRPECSSHHVWNVRETTQLTRMTKVARKYTTIFTGDVPVRWLVS